MDNLLSVFTYLHDFIAYHTVLYIQGHRVDCTNFFSSWNVKFFSLLYFIGTIRSIYQDVQSCSR